MVEYATISETGEKENNEDSVKVFINQPLSAYGFVLADGLGGHGHGDIASNFVTECTGAVIDNAKNFDSEILDECFETSQNLLMEEKDRTGFVSIKTTMVLLLINGSMAQWGHIGDSRLYHFRNGKVVSRTIDHSVPQMLALSGQIKESEIRHHPNRNMLLRAMGDDWDGMTEYEIDERNLKIAKGDTFLLCSDGFWEWIDEKTMTKILKKNLPAYNSLREMTEKVKLNGMGKGMDNYSAVLINIK